MKKKTVRLTDNHLIGFIDSGVGGLTVVKETLKQLPSENILFVGDTTHYPYDPRPAEQVTQYTWEVMDYLVEQGVKILMIACNTAAAVALEEIKAVPSIPATGVILPGTRAAVKRTQDKQVGIIGTIGTVRSQAYEKALKGKVPELTMTSLARPELVSVVENNEYHSSVAKKIVAETLTPLTIKKIDTLILGCIYYPLLRPIIQNTVGEDIQLIDFGAETVGEVFMLLDYSNLSSSLQNGQTLRQFYTTGSAKLLQETAEDWLGVEHLNVDHVELGGNKGASWWEKSPRIS